MQFTPKSEEEVKADQAKFVPWPSGEYDGEVLEAIDDKSQAGNDQIKLLCVITNDEGHHRKVFDYLLEAMSAKLRNFCIHTGLTAEYEAGTLSAKDCAGQSFRAKVKLEKRTKGYNDKNVITDYVARQSTAPKPKPAAPSRTTPPAQPSGGNGDLSARESARKTFLSRWSLFLNEFPGESANQSKFWSEAFKAFFPGKQPDAIAASEWMRFSTALKDWDPIKGFPVPSTSPISDEPVFVEDDSIPF